jgi:hypothetical protein
MDPDPDPAIFVIRNTAFGKMSQMILVRQMLDAGRLLTAGELGLHRKLGRGTSKQETFTTFLANAHNFLQGEPISQV